MLCEVHSEAGVFVVDGVLADVGDEGQTNDAREDTQGTADEERVLPLLDLVVSAGCNDIWEDVRALRVRISSGVGFMGGCLDTYRQRPPPYQ
jgi:hypothetical protein